MKTRRVVVLLVLTLIFLVLLYLPFTWPTQGTRHIILHNLQIPQGNVAKILTKPRFSKMLRDHHETNLKGLECSKTLNSEHDWRILKNLLFQDFELNLIDCGIGCGFLALAAAKSGRHVLAIQTHESKITAFRDKINLNQVDQSLLQYSHLSVHIKEQSLETILNRAVFQRAVLKIEGPLQNDDHSSVSQILESKDIASIMIINNQNCQDFNKFISAKGFYPVNEYFQKTEDRCQNPGIWLRNNVLNTSSKESVVTKKPTIVNPDEVPSLLNYINCVRVPDPNYHEICYSTLDRFIGKSLENKGTWDPFIWHPMKALLRKDSELGLIDIGANIGVFSLKAASMGRAVLAIEAFYPNIQRLAESIRINGFQNLITLAHNAVSNDYRTVYFSSPVDNPGGTTARFFPSDYRGKYGTVRSVTLNDFVHLAPKKAVLKVDIESSEALAFQHNCVNKLLDEIEIPAVFMEWTGVLQFDSCVDIVEMFLSRGFRAYGLAYEDWWIPGFQMPLYGRTHDEIKTWPKDIVWLKSR